MKDVTTDPDETYLDKNGLEWENGGWETTDDHLAFGGHEPGVIGLAYALLPQDGVFLDVGAHVGLWSLNLARTKASAVVAVEANPNTYSVLKRNIARNADRLNGMVSPQCVAAWDKTELLELVDENGKETGGSTRCVERGGEKEVLSVVTHGKPLDDWVSVKPDLIKIDVEGAEARVLRGAHRIINESRPRMIIEMHDVYFGPQVREETLKELFELSYVWNDDVKFGGGYYLVAQPREVVEATLP